MIPFITPRWSAPKHITAYTTLRDTWQEKTDIKNLLRLTSQPIWLKQTHSTIALEATPENLNEIGDACYSRNPNYACVVFTADCLPILLCNESGTEIAAIHAGWRGLAGGIIENTVQHLSTDTPWLAWLGPAIGPSKFEVGDDVYEAFTTQHDHAKSAFQSISNNKWLANLYQLAALRLKQLNITQLFGGDYCTNSQSDLFYSYRLEKEKAGRMASVIVINER